LYYNIVRFVPFFFSQYTPLYAVRAAAGGMAAMNIDGGGGNKHSGSKKSLQRFQEYLRLFT
jgi:hypothetical protein